MTGCIPKEWDIFIKELRITPEVAMRLAISIQKEVGEMVQMIWWTRCGRTFKIINYMKNKHLYTLQNNTNIDFI